MLDIREISAVVIGPGGEYRQGYMPRAIPCEACGEGTLNERLCNECQAAQAEFVERSKEAKP